MCQRVEVEGWSLRAAAEAAGISERRATAWLGRWRAGDRELADRPSVARSSPARTPAEVQDAICALRELRFSGVRIAEVLGMPERTVRAVLARHGLAKLAPIDTHEPKHR
jgi:DNA-directed RNA polymerase specialized sigma24 family protein